MDITPISFYIIVFIASLTKADEGLQATYNTKNIRFLEYKATNVLECQIINVSPLNIDNFSIKWLKNETTLEPSKEDPPRYVFEGEKLIIHKTRDEDIANYTCLLVSKKNPSSRLARADIVTQGIPTVKIVSQGTFIEGQKISIECVVTGKPPPSVYWKFGNTTYKNSEGRITLSKLKNSVANTHLLIESAEMSDRGAYICTAVNPATEFFNLTVSASTFVRVKDKLAALWPFIGICAEVVVLCVIIFIYERKRNKSELDESDTDQSPEQKNTPDHGKESVRQRK